LISALPVMQLLAAGWAGALFLHDHAMMIMSMMLTNLQQPKQTGSTNSKLLTTDRPSSGPHNLLATVTSQLRAYQAHSKLQAAQSSHGYSPM
jgi:hypothetical protein